MQTSNKKVNTTGFFDLSFIIFAFSLEIRCVTVENMDVLGQNINMLVYNGETNKELLDGCVRRFHSFQIS